MVATEYEASRTWKSGSDMRISTTPENPVLGDTGLLITGGSLQGSDAGQRDDTVNTDQLERAKVLHLNPLILTIDDFVSDEECESLIATAKPLVRPATVYEAGKGAVRSEKRSNSWSLLDPAEHAVAGSLTKAVSEFIGLSTECAEGLWGLHYTVGERFAPHLDSFEVDGSDQHRAILEKCGGQRLYTVICYLNDGYAGGQTIFPRAKVQIKPKRGTLLLFANTMTGSRVPSPLSLHAGAEVTKGEKWAVTIWWREHGIPYELMKQVHAGKRSILA